MQCSTEQSLSFQDLGPNVAAFSHLAQGLLIDRRDRAASVARFKQRGESTSEAPRSTSLPAQTVHRLTVDFNSSLLFFWSTRKTRSARTSYSPQWQ